MRMAFFKTTGKSQAGNRLSEGRGYEGDLPVIGIARDSDPPGTSERHIRDGRVISMRSRFGYPLSAAAVLLAIGGISAFILWRSLVPSLEDVRALARVRRFAQAQALLQRYLRVYPNNARARLLMAELLTEPGKPNPKQALEHLGRIRPESIKQAALVKFFAGKAHYQEKRYDLAEASWREALDLDPIVPEAGWMLVDLLDTEGRVEDAHRLGMRLHQVEPDPRDRVKILLEMCRLDIETADPLSQVILFEPLVKAHPENLPLSLTLGQSMIRVNRSDEGLEILKNALARHPDSPEAWDAWLTGLYQASEADRFSAEYHRLPKKLAANPRFAKHEGMIAQIGKDWPRAVAAYQRAFAYEPFNWPICNQLLFVLRLAGETAEFERVHRIYETYKVAYRQMRGSYYERFIPEETSSFPEEDFNHQRGAYYETLSIKTLGLAPHTELYQQLADLREKMGRFDEARAWHRQVLRDSPHNALSLAALERLK
jgi:tetratricopeptide (TPR) repeat protein